MEAAFTKFRTVFAVVATIVVAAAMFQTVAPASGEQARMPVVMPAELLGATVGGRGARRALTFHTGEKLRKPLPRLGGGKDGLLAVEQLQPLADERQRLGRASGT